MVIQVCQVLRSTRGSRPLSLCLTFPCPITPHPMFPRQQRERGKYTGTPGQPRPLRALSFADDRTHSAAAPPRQPGSPA